MDASSQRRWNGKAEPEPGDVLRVRGHGAGVVARCEGDQLVLRLHRADMTVSLPWPDALGRLVPLASASRLRALLRTLDEPGESLGPRNHHRQTQIKVAINEGEPRDWIELLRSYATAAAGANRAHGGARFVGVRESGAVRSLSEALADELAAGDPKRYARALAHVRDSYDIACKRTPMSNSSITTLAP